jgi:MFS family permease
MRHLFAAAVLRQQALAFATAMLVIGFMEPVAFSVATDELHHGAGFLGVLIFAQGVGAVVGGPSAAPILHRAGGGRLIAAGLALGSAGVLTAAVPEQPVVLAGFALVGLALPWIIVGFTTTLQRNTPPELLGRADGAAGLLIGAPQALSIATGSALLAVFAYRDLIYVTSGVLAVTAVGLATRRAQRPVREADGGGDESGGDERALVDAVG